VKEAVSGIELLNGSLMLICLTREVMQQDFVV
jgi:hypothetical protein